VQELDVKVQMEQGYVTRNAKQARDMRESTSKLLALEKTLQSFVEDFEKERQFMRDQWTKASESMNKEVDGYRRLVDVRPPPA
jgi:ribosomal protein S17E